MFLSKVELNFCHLEAEKMHKVELANNRYSFSKVLCYVLRYGKES